MKRMALLTVLMGLLFVGITSALALPPIQYYVRWSERPVYDCMGTPGNYTLSVHLTHLEYFIPAGAETVENTIADNSFGHSAYVFETLNPQWTSGTHKHYTYTINSAMYPITLKEVLTTNVHGSAVYRSTFVAHCTANAQGLKAKVTNDADPLSVGTVTPISGSNP